MLIKETGCYPVLRAMLRARSLTMETVAGYAGCSVPSMNAKMQGKSGFWLDEAIAIKQALGSNEPLEILFKKQ